MMRPELSFIILVSVLVITTPDTVNCAWKWQWHWIQQSHNSTQQQEQHKQPLGGQTQPKMQPLCTDGLRGLYTGIVSQSNEYRSMHCAPPLIEKQRIIRHAQDFADEMAASNTLKHSRTSRQLNLGENLYTEPTMSRRGGIKCYGILK
jgi:uncharacterized protein YkwD